MKYDSIIRNGTCIDFESGKKYTADICIKDGVIVESSASLDAEALHIVDAKGKYVLPGLIDEHAHWNYGNSTLGVDADMVCPAAGITSAVDAGSTGADNFEAFYRTNILRYSTDVYAYLHVSSYGVMVNGTSEEDNNPENINEKKILELFKQYHHCLRGLKIRISMHTLGSYGLLPLKKTVEIADRINALGYTCAVAVHSAELPRDMEIASILALLRSGDVYTHPYQNMGPTILDKDYKVVECVRRARERGIKFSTGNGGKHWAWQILKPAYADGFYPDFISSDIVRYNKYIRPGFNLLYAMCTSLIAGMDELDILRAVTYSPAKNLGILDRAGTLKTGTAADITIMDTIRADVSFADRFGETQHSEKIFLPLMTLKNGEVVFRQVFFDSGNDNSVILKNYM